MKAVDQTVRILPLHDAQEVEDQQKRESIGEAQSLARNRRRNRGTATGSGTVNTGLRPAARTALADEIGRRPHFVDDVERSVHGWQEIARSPRTSSRPYGGPEEFWPES